MLIDEVQRVPDLWLAIKHTVDRDPRPGRFLLTGSARLLALRNIPDALPGRSETIELWPLSQGEIDGTADDFVDAVFEYGADLRVAPQDLNRKDYLARATRGGYPEAVRRATPRRRAHFFDSYLSDIMARDVKQVADIERASDMRRLISLLAAQAGGLLNVSRLANDLRISTPTVRNYLEILETIYLVRLVPAWSANATTRAIATPKLIFVDSGMAAHLTPGAPDDSHGGLLENFRARGTVSPTHVVKHVSPALPLSRPRPTRSRRCARGQHRPDCWGRGQGSRDRTFRRLPGTQIAPTPSRLPLPRRSRPLLRQPTAQLRPGIELPADFSIVDSSRTGLTHTYVC